MSKLKISLIIPAHNEEKHILPTLETAILNSAGKLFEIIVVDNASTDKTAESASSFPEVRIVKEQNKGLTHARQRGFIESKGEILAFIDADTLMPPSWVDNIEREFLEDENLACLSGPYIYYDVPAWQKILVWLYWRLIALPSYFVIGYMTVGGNFAIKKEVVHKMGGFDTSISFYGKVKFSITHTMHTSGRRFYNQGFLNTALKYMVNFASEVVRKKPATKKYQDFR